MSIFKDKYWEELVFPDLLLGENNGYIAQKYILCCCWSTLLNDWWIAANANQRSNKYSYDKNDKNKFNCKYAEQKWREFVSVSVTSGKAFTFVNTIKKTPAYWRKFFLEVLAMIKKLGLSTFFLTFSCSDLRWNEHISIISKLESNVLSEYKI